jgi:hypothetical protein
MAMTRPPTRTARPRPCGGVWLLTTPRRRVPLVCLVLAAVTAMLLLVPAMVAGESPEAAHDGTSRLRLLPVPFFITEPAIGRGLGASLMIFHPRQKNQAALAEVHVPDAGVEISDGQREPPSVTAVFGGYTDKDTWVAGVAHSASWRSDRVRYLGALMSANVNATVYLGDRPVGFTSRGTFLLQGMSAQVGSSRVFLGGKVKANWSEASLKLDLGEDEPIRVGLGDTTDVGLAVQGLFDTRDSTFTPSRGRFVRLEVWRHDTSFGGDFDYWKTAFKALSFHPLTSDLILGLRFEGAAASGDPPFWGYPWIKLRGVPAMRYQDERVVALEGELRWNFLSRWAVVGFVGGGASDGDLAQFESQDPLVAGGVGVRYLFASDLGLWVGADVARGPEEGTWYIQIGHAW